MAIKKASGPPEAFEGLYKTTIDLLSIDWGDADAGKREADNLNKLQYHSNRITKWRKNYKRNRLKRTRKSTK